jgi:hypothetical protein
MAEWEIGQGSGLGFDDHEPYSNDGANKAVN